MATAAADLRRLLERRWPGAVPVTQRTTPSLATGIAPLDAVLPGGGLPRGRLTVWTPGPGATAVLRSACMEVAGRRERSAWIDAARLASGEASWEGICLVRPAAEADAPRAAEELLHSGGFALVVLAGARTEGPTRVRLCRAAGEGGTALVEVSEDGWMAGLRITSRVGPGGYRWRRNRLGEPVEVEEVEVRVRATALGWSREAEVVLPVGHHELRVSLEPGLGDRRGKPR